MVNCFSNLFQSPKKISVKRGVYVCDGQSDICTKFGPDRVNHIWLFTMMLCRCRFSGTGQHTPCLAHVVNLAVQEILGKNRLKAEAPNESILYDADNDAQGLVNGRFTQNEVVPADEGIDFTTAVNPLSKVRKGIVKIGYSTAYAHLQALRNLTVSLASLPNANGRYCWN